jgi:pimeloyl-ACP methyl ester carboxylesterase
LDKYPHGDSGAHIRIRGIRTHVRIFGEGQPVLVLGGFWGDLAAWERLAPYLRGFRLIAFDAPGIGDTAVPVCPTTLPDLADFALAVLDAVGHRHAHVLGISFGGVVAEQVAVIAPDRVDRLVLVSTSAGLLDLLSQSTSALRLAWSLVTARRGAAAGALFGGRVRDDPAIPQRLGIRPPHTLTGNLYRFAGLAGRYELPWSIHRPTLVLNGDDDPLVPYTDGRVLASLITGASAVVVPGGGHLMLFDSPEVVGPMVADFLVTGEPAKPVAGSDGHLSR